MEILNLVRKNIALVAIDEAHVVLQDSLTYRFRLGGISSLGDFIKSPFLLLSGTYSPELEQGTYSFYRKPATEWKVFRSGTARQNIMLRLLRVESESAKVHRIQTIVQAFIDETTDKCMVFVATRKEAVELSSVCTSQWGIQAGKSEIHYEICL
jgi:superfamily II DNA helicase RecQ